MITEKDADLLETRFREVFATKEELQKMKSNLLSKLDSILKEILATREEMTIMTHKVTDHEERITALETTKA